MAAQPKPVMTEEEYLALERAGETRHEYYAGESFAMVGASEPHVLIGMGTAFSLYGQLRARPCKVYTNDMRVRISATRLYTYPDIIVVCGEPQFADDSFDTLLNPTVIVEILSPSTESYDRGRKFQHYRALPSLKEYLLIAQDAYHIDHFVRQGDQSWLLTEADGPAASLHLPSISCDLALADIYEKVTITT